MKERMLRLSSRYYASSVTYVLGKVIHPNESSRSSAGAGTAAQRCDWLQHSQSWRQTSQPIRALDSPVEYLPPFLRMAVCKSAIQGPAQSHNSAVYYHLRLLTSFRAKRRLRRSLTGLCFLNLCRACRPQRESIDAPSIYSHPDNPPLFSPPRGISERNLRRNII